jgi:NADH-quinone oxidoreductase subunit N
MTYTFMGSLADWERIAPVLVLVGMTLVVMLVDLILPHEGERSKHSGPQNFAVLPILALLGVLGSIAATITLFFIGDQQRAFNEMLGSDSASLYAFLIILTASGLGILLSPAYLRRLNLVHQGEYYALLLLATTGMMIMAAATSFMTVFLGIEMLSLALYILCSFVARRKMSQESGMKYFLLSSFASAFLLYGIALTYGATGNTSFIGVAQVVAKTTGHAPTLLLVAMGLMAVGFTFKISAIPFQAWTPDVYQGAPAPITAFMSVGTKAAALIAFVRVFDFVLWPVHQDWLPVVWVIAVLTIVGGNVMALVQSNVKRLLAYSSIAHGGYLLIGVIVGQALGASGASAVLFYLLSYAFLNTGAFGVISVLEKLDNSGSDAEDLRGLWYRRPLLAGLLAFFLLGLAGFPPLAGFAAKYYLFYAAATGGHIELLIIGVLASVLGMYYYLRTISTMFMEREKVAEAVVSAVPTTPTPERRSSRRGTGGLSRGGAATAVAVRLAATKVATPVEEPVVVEENKAGKLHIFSGIALVVSALGTLAMGTVLPFWLVNLAQQAATMMLK